MTYVAYASLVAMDPETKSAFEGLADGQAKLVAQIAQVIQGQDALTERVGRDLSSLAEAQVRTESTVGQLAENVSKLTEMMGRLTQSHNELVEAHTQTEANLNRVAHLLGELASAHAELRDEVRHLGERMDGFTRDVMRGFTESTERDREIGARLDALERGG